MPRKKLATIIEKYPEGKKHELKSLQLISSGYEMDTGMLCFVWA
jgi:hypothetical protein